MTTTTAKSSSSSAVGPLVKIIVKAGQDEGGEGWEGKMRKMEGVLSGKNGMFLKWDFGEEEEDEDDEKVETVVMEDGGVVDEDKGYDWLDDPEGAFLYGVTKGRRDDEKVGSMGFVHTEDGVSPSSSSKKPTRPQYGDIHANFSVDLYADGVMSRAGVAGRTIVNGCLAFGERYAGIITGTGKRVDDFVNEEDEEDVEVDKEIVKGRQECKHWSQRVVHGLVAEGLRSVEMGKGLEGRNAFITLKRLVDMGVVEEEGWERCKDFLTTKAGGLGVAIAVECGAQMEDDAWKGWFDVGYGGIMLNTPEGEDEEEERKAWSYDGVKERIKERNEELTNSSWKKSDGDFSGFVWYDKDEEDGSIEPLPKLKVQTLEGLDFSSKTRKWTNHVLPRFNVFEEDDEVGGEMEKTFNRTDKRMAIEQLRDLIVQYRPTFTPGCVVAGKDEDLISEILKMTRCRGGRDLGKASAEDDEPKEDDMDTTTDSSPKISDVDTQLVTLSLLTLGLANTFKPLLVAKLAFQLGQQEQLFNDAFMVCVVKIVEDVENLTRGARYRLREITSIFIKMAGGSWPVWKRWSEDSEENPVVEAFAKGVALDIVDGVGRDTALAWLGEDGKKFLVAKPETSEGIVGIKAKLQMSIREIKARPATNIPEGNPILAIFDVHNDEIERSEELTRTREVALAVFELAKGFPGSAISEVMEKDVELGQTNREGAVKVLLDSMFECVGSEGTTSLKRALKAVVRSKVISATEVSQWILSREDDLKEGSWNMMELLKVSIWEVGKGGDNCSFDDDEDDDDDDMEEEGKRGAVARSDIDGAFKVLLDEVQKGRKEGAADRKSVV